MPTRAGQAAVPAPATRDAAVVERLRRAGAVILGKTHVPDSLSTSSANFHTGAAHNPWRHGFQAGGSSSGSAIAVAAGLAAAAIGTDTLGSIRIPASHCGVFALKPTHAQLSLHGVATAARRLDSVGVVGRSVDDLGVLLHVLAGHDARDPCSRRRSTRLDFPDWQPDRLRTGVLDLAAFGTDAAVASLFQRALEQLRPELGEHRAVDFGELSIGRARRAALLVAEAEMLATRAAELDPETLSPALRAQFDFARSRSAADYVAADRLVDAAVLAARRLFEQVDVLVTPTTPQVAFALDAPLPDNHADFTCLANIAGCPALSMPMGLTADGLPAGLQFIGPPGSDLRLLELAEVCAAALDATPEYPIEAAGRA
jgi:aspartyl-tRNA(Asn)/glutamyl-tRNA(Gln) amidotransferase subunit A